MFQRRHYLAIAKAMLKLDQDARQRACSVLADLFERDNPAFDRFRFASACGFTPPPLGVSVSFGTLKPDDLHVSLWDAAYNLLCDLREFPDVDHINQYDTETLSMFVDELFGKLNDVAPPGYYFGSLEGDGADFGFWSMEWEGEQ